MKAAGQVMNWIRVRSMRVGKSRFERYLQARVNAVNDGGKHGRIALGVL
jgi:hypothetical protein